MALTQDSSRKNGSSSGLQKAEAADESVAMVIAANAAQRRGRSRQRPDARQASDCRGSEKALPGFS
jgi:hypothetical protein